MFDKFRTLMNSGTVSGYFFQAIPITLIVGIVYSIIRIAVIKKKKLGFSFGKELVKLLFVCYLTGLITLVILPANFWLKLFDGIFYGWWNNFGPVFSFGCFNFVPSVVKALSGELTLGSWVKTMLIGNIVMFLPLGFFLPFVSKKVNNKNIFILAALIPIAAELLQLIFGRSFDVDDLICNFIGIVAGYFIARGIIGTKKRQSKPD